MIRVESRSRRLLAPLLALALVGAAFGSKSSTGGKVSLETTTSSTAPKGPDTTAAQLRMKVNGLLQEHVFLVSAATAAALGGRSDEYAAARAALDDNSTALDDNATAVFGTEPGKTFGDLWKKRPGFLIAYAQGLAGHDGGKAAQALSDLNQYGKDLGAFLHGALPALPAEAITALVGTDIQDL